MRPRLVHPTEVTLEQPDRAGTAIDPITREPVGDVAKVERHLTGQVHESRGERLRMTRSGAEGTANAAGRVVFDIDALAAAGVVVSVGDRFTAVGARAVNWRVLRVEEHAQYGGRAYHLWAIFDDEARA